MVGLLSDLSSWQPRTDRELLTEIAELSLKRTRAYVIAITYFPVLKERAGTFYDQGITALVAIRMHAIDYEGGSPAVELDLLKDLYSEFRAYAEDLTSLVAAEMAKTIGPI